MFPAHDFNDMMKLQVSKAIVIRVSYSGSRSSNSVRAHEDFETFLTNVIDRWVHDSVAMLDKELGRGWASTIAPGSQVDTMKVWTKLVLSSKGAGAIPRIRQVFDECWRNIVSEL